jgi:hypothetical protein
MLFTFSNSSRRSREREKTVATKIKARDGSHRDNKF